MSNPKFSLTERQKQLRGVIFVSLGLFLITQYFSGENPSPFLIWILWALAGFALAATLLFIWTMWQGH
jgi:hypothetical protein